MRVVQIVNLTWFRLPGHRCIAHLSDDTATQQVIAPHVHPLDNIRIRILRHNISRKLILSIDDIEPGMEVEQASPRVRRKPEKILRLLMQWPGRVRDNECQTAAHKYLVHLQRDFPWHY